MQMTGVSLLGWVHSAACMLALLLGGALLLGPKGTARHKRLGRLYFYTMLAVNLSVFGIYHFDVVIARPPRVGPGLFGIFHWEATVTLLVLLLGFYAASRQRRAIWAYVHPFSMLFTYYMLVGGLINELFVRVHVLRAIAATQLHSGQNVAQTPVVGLSQFAAMIFFIVLLVYYMAKVALYRRRARLAAA